MLDYSSIHHYLQSKLSVYKMKAYTYRINHTVNGCSMVSSVVEKLMVFIEICPSIHTEYLQEKEVGSK